MFDSGEEEEAEIVHLHRKIYWDKPRADYEEFNREQTTEILT